MNYTLTFLILLSLVMIWMRQDLIKRRCHALLFLTIQSESSEKSLLLRKPVILQAPPLPGMEINTDGIEELKVSRSVIQTYRGYDVLVYLDKVQVPDSDYEKYIETLTKKFGWQMLW